MIGRMRQTIRIIGNVVSTLLLLIATPAFAGTWALLVAESERYGSRNYIARYIIDDALRENARGQAILAVYPERDPKHRDLIALLKPGMPFDQPAVRGEIATILASFPRGCLHNELALIVSPLEHIDTWVPDVKDKRRVAMLSVHGCLREQPLECTYTRADNGATGFGIGDLKRILRSCREALVRDLDAGALFVPEIYLAGSDNTGAAMLRARQYFRLMSSNTIPKPPTPSDEQTLAYINSRPDWRRCYQGFDFNERNANICSSLTPDGRNYDVLQCSATGTRMDFRQGRYEIWESREHFFSLEKYRAQEGIDACLNPKYYAAERSELLEKARDQIDTTARVQAYERAWHQARAQILDMRHQIASAAAFAERDKRINPEALYFRACLSFAHAHSPPEQLGPAPREADPEHPYQCAFYADNDYRYTFLNTAVPGRGIRSAYELFEKVAGSDNRKLAARAHWNLALLESEEDSVVEEAPSRMKHHLAKARELDPEAFRP